MNRKLLTLVSILLTFLIVTIYWGITKTFYQQDEWLGYGLYLAKGSGMILQSTGSVLGISLGQGRILTNLTYFVFHTYFPLNVFPIAIFSITIHIINSFLVYILGKNLFKNKISSLIGTLFFAFNSLHLNAIAWPAAAINTLPSTTLILIALLFYFRYIKEVKAKWMIMCFALIYTSLFFKETGIFLFILLPLSLIFYKGFDIKTVIKKFWYYFLPLILIVSYRLWGFRSETGEVALFVTGTSKYFMDSLIIRSFLYPITSMSLSLFHPSYMLEFARYITNVYYPFIPEAQFALVTQTIALDLIAVLATALIIVTILILMKFVSTNVKKNVLFWMLFLLASFLPYIIISKSFSYLESRYYYLSSVAWAIIFTLVANLISEKVRPKYLQLLFLAIFLSFIYVNIILINYDLKLLVKESQTRIDILNQISLIKPKLTENRNIFYVTGDTDYYLIGHKIPFQQGFGYTLLTFYFDKSQYPADFLNNTDLFEIGKEMYYEKDEYGFGYFSNIILMEEAVKSNKIPTSNVYRFYYDSKTARMEKI